MQIYNKKFKKNCQKNYLQETKKSHNLFLTQIKMNLFCIWVLIFDFSNLNIYFATHLLKNASVSTSPSKNVLTCVSHVTKESHSVAFPFTCILFLITVAARRKTLSAFQLVFIYWPQVHGAKSRMTHKALREFQRIFRNIRDRVTEFFPGALANRKIQRI